MEVYQIESDELSRIEESELSSEETLENYLVRSDGAEIGGIKLLYVGRQGSPGEGGIFDIAALDRRGDVVIIELKRDRTPREIVAQALEYAASIRSHEYEQLRERYREFHDDDEASLKAKHTEFFNREDDPLSEREYNTDQRLLLVGSEFSDLSLDMADFLREHSVDVICVSYSSFVREGEREELRLLTTESVRRSISEEPASVSGGGSSQESTVEVLNQNSIIATFEERYQSDAIESVANFLISEYDLIERIEIPYRTGDGEGERALINNTATHPDGSEMHASRELNNGYHILTNLSAEEKNKYINELTQCCGLNARVQM